jgi:hypothetical protein
MRVLISFTLKQTMQDKAQEFFKTMRDLMALISTEDTNNVLCNVILLVNLLRVILLPCFFYAGCWAARFLETFPELTLPSWVAGHPVHKPAPSLGTFDRHRLQRSRHIKELELSAARARLLSSKALPERNIHFYICTLINLQMTFGTRPC